MDFWGIIIILSIVASGLLMIVGPVLEMRGKIFFLEAKHAPKTAGRWGMGLMLLSAVLFFGGLFARAVLPSEIVAPVVLSAYIMWFVGGIAAVVRNESLKLMVPSENEKTQEEGGHIYETRHI